MAQVASAIAVGAFLMESWDQETVLSAPPSCLALFLGIFLGVQDISLVFLEQD